MGESTNAKGAARSKPAVASRAVRKSKASTTSRHSAPPCSPPPFAPSPPLLRAPTSRCGDGTSWRRTYK
eukprot:5504679-Pleurochrysis_carterae.AAC.1